MTQETTSLVLRPNKMSAIWLLLGCTLFVAIALQLTQEGGWTAYFIAGFFGLGIPIAIVQLLPNSTYLRISDDGLSFSSMYRVSTIQWDTIDRFFVVSLKTKMVGFNFVPSYECNKISRRVSLSLSNCECALPHTYGKKAEELADILNRCLLEFKQTNGEPCD